MWYPKQLLAIIIAFLPIFLSAQIVNTEELRFNASDKKVVGLIDMDLGLNRNKAGMSIRAGLDLRLELNNEQSRWMFLGGYRLTRFTNLNNPGSLPTNFLNRGFAHLRYNKNLSDKTTLEVFSQYQFDEIQEIDRRILHGIGPRFELIATDSAHLHIGALYMYEYEETSEDPEQLVYNKDHRLSSYVSFGFQFNEFVSLTNVTYFQPNLSKLNDYRLTTNLLLNAAFSKWVGFKVSINLVYDNQPPLTVPNAMYDLSTGLYFRF